MRNGELAISRLDRFGVMMRRGLVAAAIGGASLALICSTTLQAKAVDSGVTVRTLAQGTVKALHQERSSSTSARLGADTQKNVDGRLGAVAIAGGLIVLVILLCAATFMRGSRRQITLAVLSSLAIGGGILPLFGATSNDYYFIAVRPDAQRMLAMPRPDGHVFYTSPDIDLCRQVRTSSR